MRIVLPLLLCLVTTLRCAAAAEYEPPSGGGGGGVDVLSAVIDGGGSPITSGRQVDLHVPFTCTINEIDILADQSGSITVDLWKDSYANFPPTGADDITGGASPALSSVTKYQDATLSGWTTSVTAGQVIRLNIPSTATSITRITVALKVTKT